MTLNLACCYSVTYVRFIYMRETPRDILMFSLSQDLVHVNELFGLGAQEYDNITNFSHCQIRISQ